MMYLMSLDKKTGFKGMDYCVPKFVAKSDIFARNCQREYCRQELYFLNDAIDKAKKSLATGFRPLSGSYISQYHPRNPMSCLGRIGGLRGKSNFIEIQPFWKVKSSHKSSI